MGLVETHGKRLPGYIQKYEGPAFFQLQGSAPQGFMDFHTENKIRPVFYD